MLEFKVFQKIPRFSRPCVITEKIDGTNGLIAIGEDGEFKIGSRNRWITPEQDNYGFATWAHKHKEELLTLGPGFHYGEWWGVGIQRNYGLSERRFSLFNVDRWSKDEVRPKCCRVVPILFEGDFGDNGVEVAIDTLRIQGSKAEPGFMQPEGIVVYHFQGRVMFKKTLENDQNPKGA